MGVLNITPPEVNIYRRQSFMIQQFMNATSDQLVMAFRKGRNMLWNQPGWTVADAQATIDEMGDNAIPVFQLTGALGEFLATYYPGALTDEELASPVPYSLVDGKIVLDPEAKYPTEN